MQRTGVPTTRQIRVQHRDEREYDFIKPYRSAHYNRPKRRARSQHRMLESSIEYVASEDAHTKKETKSFVYLSSLDKKDEDRHSTNHMEKKATDCDAFPATDGVGV
jgi:hypothetical protein